MSERSQSESASLANNDAIVDPIGAATMSPAMHVMRAYPRYLLDKVAPALGRRVWEIGVGHGQYTAILRSQDRTVLGTDIDVDCLSEVKKRFADDAQVSTGLVDLRDRDSVIAHQPFSADSVVCLNVLEHIEDDVAALRWIGETCGSGAGLGLIVPAHQFLYGKMDEQAGHYRRYCRTRVRRVLSEAGWKIERLVYINAIAALGWWWHNRVRKNAGLDDQSVNSQMTRADRLLPRIARVTDPLLGRVAGLSVLAIARNSTE